MMRKPKTFIPTLNVPNPDGCNSPSVLEGSETMSPDLELNSIMAGYNISFGGPSLSRTQGRALSGVFWKR